MVRRGPKHCFVQIPLVNYIDISTSWLVNVGQKSHMKIDFSCAKKVVGHMAVDVGQLVTVLT